MASHGTVGRDARHSGRRCLLCQYISVKSVSWDLYIDWLHTHLAVPGKNKRSSIDIFSALGNLEAVDNKPCLVFFWLQVFQLTRSDMHPF
jgi:hypothetical protein